MLRVLVLLPAIFLTVVEADDLEMFGSLAEGYASNRESFTTFTCRFTWTVGSCLSIDAAMEGEISDPISHEGLWMVDGERCRYELVCDPAVFQPAVERILSERQDSGDGQGSQNLPCKEFFYLKNGRIRARQSKLVQSVNLFTPDMQDRAGLRITPFALGIMAADEVSSPSVFLGGVREGRFEGRYNGILEYQGRSVLSVSIGKKDEPMRMGYYLDPERGYLPLKLWDSDPESGEMYYEARVLDVKDCGDGRWFPMRAIVINGDPSVSGVKQVQYTEVTELTLEKPDSSDFYLDVPAGTQVTISGEKFYTNITSDRRVEERDLIALKDECITHFETVVRRHTGATPTKRYGVSLLIVNGALVLCAVVVWIVWRRRAGVSS